jgi:hypothetical protein
VLVHTPSIAPIRSACTVGGIGSRVAEGHRVSDAQRP